MTLAKQIAPFHGKRVDYVIPENSRQLVGALGLKAPGGRLKLFVFDWKKLDEEVKETICEKAGQDDYHVFAVINGNPEADGLEEILEAKHQGFLMFADDRPERIYLGDGEMNTFTTDVAEFLAGLKPAGGDDD